MANTFIDPTLVARDAAIELHGSLMAAGLIPGKHDQKFASKVGQTIKVKTRPVMSANRHTGSGAFTTSDVTESYTNLSIAHRVYVKHKLTAEERTFSVDDFATQVVRPAMLAMAQDIDLWLIANVLARGFARYLTGTDGTEASTLEHLAAAWQQMFDNKGLPEGKMAAGLLTSTTAANFLQLAAFVTNAQKAGDDSTLRTGIFSPVYNMRLWPVQSAGAHTRGDVAGTVLVKGGSQTGTSLIVDGLSSATGTINKGTRFTAAGDTTVHTLTADATIASNEATLVFTPTLAASPADNAAVTFKTAFKQNVIFNPDAAAKVIIAPEPQWANPSSVGVFEGISIRTTFDSTLNDASTGDGDFVLFDAFIGGSVIEPKGGVIMQG